MQIFLENKSNKTLNINLNGQQITLLPFGSDFFSFSGNRVSLNLSTGDTYSSEKYSAKAGFYWLHRFITESQYDFTPEKEIAVELYVETKKGDHFESYQRVIPYSKDFSFPEPIYTVKNEAGIKKKMANSNKRLKRLDKAFAVYEKWEDIKLVLGIIFLAACFLLVAVTIFNLMWTYIGHKTAVFTFVILAIIGAVFVKLIKKLLNKLKRGAEKVLDSKTFNKAMDKAMDKAEEKFEENFVYCKGMPEDLYKDQNSFFDNDYISAVFEYSTKQV